MALNAVGDCQNCLVSWVVGCLCQSIIVASTSLFSTTGRRRNPVDVHETPFLLVRKAQKIFDWWNATPKGEDSKPCPEQHGEYCLEFGGRRPMFHVWRWNHSRYILVYSCAVTSVNFFQKRCLKLTQGDSGSLLEFLQAIAKAFCLDAFVSHHGSRSTWWLSELSCVMGGGGFLPE